MKFLVLVFALLNSSFALALICTAAKSGRVSHSKQEDQSDYSIDLGHGQFVWIGLVGEPAMNLDIMRPATTEEQAQSLSDGERYPAANTSIFETTVSLQDLEKGFHAVGYFVRCRQ